MAASKFLKLISGGIAEVIALVTSAGAADADKIVATDATGRINPTLMPAGAPVDVSAGAGDAGKLPKLDAGGKIDNSFMPVGIGGDSRSVTASEALSAGSLVNLWMNAGTVNARKADATVAGKEAVGYVLASVASGATALVFFDGTISGLSGLTPGNQFLATTAGGMAAVPPAASGNIVQSVGFAPSATELVFEAGDPITLA